MSEQMCDEQQMCPKAGCEFPAHGNEHPCGKRCPPCDYTCACGAWHMEGRHSGVGSGGVDGSGQSHCYDECTWSESLTPFRKRLVKFGQWLIAKAAEKRKARIVFRVKRVQHDNLPSTTCIEWNDKGL